MTLGPVAGRMFDRFGGRWSLPLAFRRSGTAAPEDTVREDEEPSLVSTR